MPYVSNAQRKWAHTQSGIKSLGGMSKVSEWDKSSKGLKLPEHIKSKFRKAYAAKALNK